MGVMNRLEYETAQKLAFPDMENIPNIATWGKVRYTTSKLCNVLCTYELDRKLKEQGLSTPDSPITVNCYDPSMIPGTGLAR
jgi:NAD(P)-dependent dehydrogenase (short-subunit alcohol dehydrogenase family)